jgi:hypothetical protein
MYVIVLGTGIEPVSPPWKGDVLTVRRTEQLSYTNIQNISDISKSFLRRVKDSNLRYKLTPYNGLANRPFRPLRQLSFGVNDGIRTHDTKNHNLLLYQLNYIHHIKLRDQESNLDIWLMRPNGLPNLPTISRGEYRIRTCVKAFAELHITTLTTRHNKEHNQPSVLSIIYLILYLVRTAHLHRLFWVSSSLV